MAWPRWFRRAARNRHRHAIEQASRRWRGGKRDDSARMRREILISTQARPRDLEHRLDVQLDVALEERLLRLDVGGGDRAHRGVGGHCARCLRRPRRPLTPSVRALPHFQMKRKSQHEYSVSQSRVAFTRRAVRY